MKSALIIAASIATAHLSATPVDWGKLPPASTQTGVTFQKDIAPMFKASCVRCHGAEKPKSQLRLDSPEGVMKGTKQGPVVKVGDSADSLLVKSISQLDPETAMPPKPRGPRGPRPQGTNAPAMAPQGHENHNGPEAGGPPAMAGDSGHGHGSPGGTNGTFQTRLRPMGPPAKPLTPEQVGLVRAWIDQGAK